MRHPHYKKLALLLLFSLFIYGLNAQDCAVAVESLKGTYTGDCKKGKAEGTGKAVGKDTYEGEFKEGLPDGKGTYTWSNGDVYSGEFAKGHMNGKGFLRKKRGEEPDSTSEGFWKKDKFVGKYDSPYKIHMMSRHVVNTVIKKKKDPLGFNRVNIIVVNTTSSTLSLGFGSAIKMSVDEIQISQGQYTRKEVYDYMKKNETILFDVSYPLRMKLMINSETIDVELFEEGSYSIEVNINK